MLRQKTGKSVLRLPSLCLTALILSGCSALSKFPTKYIYEVDLDNKVCGKYEVTDFERMLFKHVADLPLNSCNGVFGFSSDKVGLVIDWSVKAIEIGKGKCR